MAEDMVDADVSSKALSLVWELAYEREFEFEDPSDMAEDQFWTAQHLDLCKLCVVYIVAIAAVFVVIKVRRCAHGSPRRVLCFCTDCLPPA